GGCRGVGGGPAGPEGRPEEDKPVLAKYREARWLARAHGVTVLPSVASLKTLRNVPPPATERKAFAGFGDPTFSAAGQAKIAAVATTRSATGALTAANVIQSRGLPVKLRASPKTQGLDSVGLSQLPQLPDTSDEINSIAVALNADLTKDVFLGKRANESAIKTMNLSGYKVLAFATHGLIPGDLDGLTQPALALSAPEVSGDGGDGLLTMDEILGLRLDADWVVLSACNTGSGQGAGAEAVSGLGRAFFYAGTRALLVSNWPVETTSAKTLTTDLFRRQAEDETLTRAEALRRTMMALVDGDGYVDPQSGKTVFTYSHPIFWAPFSLIGDGGRNSATGT
ncbi:MAG: CHAT domain-containing protein, partial [Alphaproteobacteria bacterium]|nr:CHAT domain-containing protein [Alphaproteobacteria bacterium]